MVRANAVKEQSSLANFHDIRITHSSYGASSSCILDGLCRQFSTSNMPWHF